MSKVTHRPIGIFLVEQDATYHAVPHAESVTGLSVPNIRLVTEGLWIEPSYEIIERVSGSLISASLHGLLHTIVCFHDYCII